MDLLKCLTLSLTTVLLGCGTANADKKDPSSEQRELAFKGYKTICEGGSGLQYCLVNQADGSLWYSPIEGFSSRWGYDTVLNVEVTPNGDNREDEGYEKFRMIGEAQDSKVKPYENFSFIIRHGKSSLAFLIPNVSETFSIDGKRISCNSSTTCQEFKTYRASNESCEIEFDFAFQSNADDDLVMRSFIKRDCIVI